MAGLRLLSAAALLLAALAASTGCTREIEVPRIAGRLSDERTGKPIEGAALYLGFSGTNPLNIGGHGSGATGRLGEQIALTDENGAFEFQPYLFRVSWFVRVISGSPAVRIVHRSYGGNIIFLSGDSEGWTNLALDVAPNAHEVAGMTRGFCDHPCGGLGIHTYAHCYELLCREHQSNLDGLLREHR